MRLQNGHKRWVFRVSYAVFATGVLWLVFHYLIRVKGEFGETAHPLEVWWLRLHGLAAFGSLLVVGSLLPVHVRTSWHQRRNLGFGIGLLSVAVLLIVTGYALYYFGGEELRPVISALHWVVGLVSALVMILHIRTGRASRPHREAVREDSAREAPLKRVA